MENKIAVFFDRDGTLNVEAGYIRDLDNLVLEENAAKSIKKLNELGVLCILVTNQTGPARDYYPESHVLALNKRLTDLLKKENAYLDKIYYCPHYENGIVKEYSFDCDCRKPKTGMIDQALKDFPEIDIKKSYVVGDKATDVELAKNASTKGVLLKTGYGEQVLDGTYQELNCQPDYIATNILDAVNWIIDDIRATITN